MGQQHNCGRNLRQIFTPKLEAYDASVLERMFCHICSFRIWSSDSLLLEKQLFSSMVSQRRNLNSVQFISNLKESKNIKKANAYLYFPFEKRLLTNRSKCQLWISILYQSMLRRNFPIFSNQCEFSQLKQNAQYTSVDQEPIKLV